MALTSGPQLLLTTPLPTARSPRPSLAPCQDWDRHRVHPQALLPRDTECQHGAGPGLQLHLQMAGAPGPGTTPPGPIPGLTHRLGLLGEPLPGEPLGDPFPWEPLLSPLNMVVEAGAGSGWTWQAAACVLAGGSAGLWRGGAAGNREERQFLGGPSLQVRPGSCACTHTHPHSHPLLHNQFGRKGQSQRAGRPSLPDSQRRSGLVTPTGSEGARSSHTQLGKQLGT